MNEAQTIVFKRTRLQNMKRRYAKFAQYPSLNDEALKLQREIAALEKELDLQWDRSKKNYEKNI